MHHVSPRQLAKALVRLPKPRDRARHGDTLERPFLRMIGPIIGAEQEIRRHAVRREPVIIDRHSRRGLAVMRRHMDQHVASTAEVASAR